MATSGLLIFARSKEVQRLLSDAFAAREVFKRYIATVYGNVEQAPDAAWHLVDAPLICDWERRPRQKVDDEVGKPSQTLFQRHPDQRGTPPNCTRIWLEPITGRSHQLRVHMSHIGLPLVGDALYAPAHVLVLDTRLHLHASELRFRHPCTNETLHIRSQAPSFCHSDLT
jgi:tRNA pseudouridine32 synthase/23S rRNA pseudouridine746 synthase